MRNGWVCGSSIVALLLATISTAISATAQGTGAKSGGYSLASGGQADGKSGQGIQEMQQVEDRWSQAVNKRDQYGLELALSPEFVGIAANGDVTTRDQNIAALFVKNSDPVSLEQKVISARFLGNIAIVNGTYVMHWKASKGPAEEKGVYSQVFEHVPQGWVCLNSQQTAVAQESAPATENKPAKKKTSEADLPFHIPLLYKGASSTKPAAAVGSETPTN